MNKRSGLLLASLTATLVAAGGCTSQPPHQATAHDPVGSSPTLTNTPTQVPPVASPAVDAIPVSVDIPTLGVHATHLMPLGVNKNGSMQTPPVDQPMTLGWYTRGAHACTPGPNEVPFALAGHINGSGHKPGILTDLKNLKTGAAVTIGLSNGSSCTYRIKQLAQVRKTAFPTNTIWGRTPAAELRIVSCGGAYIGPPLYYEDNLVGEGTLNS